MAKKTSGNKTRDSKQQSRLDESAGTETHPKTDSQGDGALSVTDKKKSGKHEDSGNTPAAASDEIGGPSGPEPTRYGDWEIGGKCVDF